jgi:hypothetical protein
MANPKDVNVVASHLKKNSVDASPLAVQKLANLPGIIFPFGGKSTSLRVVRQRADGFHELLMPTKRRRLRLFAEPFQRFVNFTQRLGRYVDRTGHRSLTFSVQFVLFTEALKSLDGWLCASRLNVFAAFA